GPELMGMRGVVAAKLQAGDAEAGMGVRLAEPVAGPLRRRERGVPDGGQVVPMALPVEVVGQDGGQLPGALAVAGRGGGLYGREQHLVLRAEPALRLGVPGELLRGRARLRGAQAERGAGRVELARGGRGGMQVVVGEPLPGLVARGLVLA